MNDWLSLVEAPVEAAGWRDILVVGDSPKLIALGRSFADRLGCYLRAATSMDPAKAIAAGADTVFVGGKVEAIVRERRPEIVLFEDASGAGVAGAFRTGILAAEVDLDIGARLLVMKTRRYGGKMIDEWICPVARPQMAIVDVCALPEAREDAARTGEIVRLT